MGRKHADVIAGSPYPHRSVGWEPRIDGGQSDPGRTTQDIAPARKNGNSMTALSWHMPPITVAPSATPIALSPTREITLRGLPIVRRPSSLCQHGKMEASRALLRLELPNFTSKTTVMLGMRNTPWCISSIR
jgi:hypothetical protein